MKYKGKYEKHKSVFTVGPLLGEVRCPQSLGSRTPVFGDITVEVQGNRVNYVLPERDLDCRITRGRGGVSQEIMPTLKDKMD